MTNPETQELVARLRGLLANATPGPWEHPYGVLVKGDDQFVARCEMMRRADMKAGDQEGRDNAALIVAAINTLPALLDAAEREQRLREGLDGAVARMVHIRVDLESRISRTQCVRRLRSAERYARAALGEEG